MRLLRSIDRSKLWLPCISGVAWFAGAGLSAAWMLHSSGFVWPIISFAVLAASTYYATVRALKMSVDIYTTAKRAMHFAACSVIVLSLGILFFEYWPVTITMAFMFAICRTFKNEDAPAYI